MTERDVLGFLDPKGNLFECGFYEHITKAKELAKELLKTFDNVPAKLTELVSYNGVEAENLLLNEGWISLRSRSVFTSPYRFPLDEFVKVPKDYNKAEINSITDEQKKWLEAHYDSMIPVKRESVDELLDMLNAELELYKMKNNFKGWVIER